MQTGVLSAEVLLTLVDKIVCPSNQDEQLLVTEKFLEILESPQSTPLVVEILRTSNSKELLFVLSEALAKSKFKESSFGLAVPTCYEPSGSETDEYAASSIFLDKKFLLDSVLEVLYQRCNELDLTVVSKFEPD